MNEGPAPQQAAAPFFSVIIPVYNRSEAVSAAITSVLAQTFTDFEIIVIDDGSTDATPDRLADFGERIRVFRQTNAGGGPARQLGISKARGTYIAFLDSDDTWFPWTLATYRRVIDETRSPSLVLGKAWHTNKEPSDPACAECHYAVHTDFLESSRHHRWYGFSVLVARSSAIPPDGVLPSTRVAAQDLHFLLMMGTSPGFVAIQSPMTAVYSVHDGNICGNPEALLDAMRHILAQEKHDKFPGGLDRRRSRRDMIYRSARAASMKSLQSGHLRAALLLYAATARWHLATMRLTYLLRFPVLFLGAALSQVMRRCHTCRC